MSFEFAGASPFKPTSCQYGASKLECRGPARSLDKPYVAFLGGNETFGKYVEHPFAALIEQQLGMACINLGCANGGLDAVSNDADLMAIAAGGEKVVLQVMEPQNLTNQFYQVHPRRNDRFVRPTQKLRQLYPDVDFSEINFNKHLVSMLLQTSPERFPRVATELKAVWVQRMRSLIHHLGQKTALLWLREVSNAGRASSDAAGLSVNWEMINDLRDDFAQLVQVPVRLAGAAGELQDMMFSSVQAPAAANTIGPAEHQKIASALTGFLKP